MKPSTPFFSFFKLLTLFCCIFGAGIQVASASQGTAGVIQSRVAAATPGQTIILQPGTYEESVTLPPGVSLAGLDPRNTIIKGRVQLSPTTENPVYISRLTIIGTGREAALLSSGGQARVQHCLISSESGFAAVQVTGGGVLLRNNIIIGPVADYAVFGRGAVNLEIVNNTVLVQGFGIGLMDGAQANIRNCLIYGKIKPAVIRLFGADYTISYSNISLVDDGSAFRRGPYYHGHDFLLGDAKPSDVSTGSNTPIYHQHPVDEANKDSAKYQSAGLSFIPHPYLKSHSIDEFFAQQPGLALYAGSPSARDANADGTRNTLGAFGGPLGSRWYSHPIVVQINVTDGKATTTVKTSAPVSKTTRPRTTPRTTIISTIRLRTLPALRWWRNRLK